MDIVAFGRAFLGITMAFHIAFALFGVGIPLMISLAELIGIVRKDGDFSAMARHWTFAMAALFVAGAISGTIVAVVFAVLLPPFMAIVSRTIILPFFIETFAFFIEAIFLGIYAYTWDAFKGKWTHWLTSLPIVVASCASAFLITTVNAWMTAPQGFTMGPDGTITGVNPWKAMFNPAVPTRTGHSIVTYYATTAFVFAAVAAWQFIKRKDAGALDKEGPRRHYYEKMMVFAMAVAVVFTVALGITGDASARYMGQAEPQKFAAAEHVMHTGSDVPLVFGGIEGPGEALRGAITIPGGLSILLGGTASTVVKGLDAFDPSTWPPFFIHYLFDLMVAIGGIMLAAVILFFIFRSGIAGARRKRCAFSKGMAWFTVVTAVASVIGVEAGWMFTEIGRQPYTITGILLTKDAFTTSSAAIAYAVVFPVFYVVLAVVTLWVLRRHYYSDRSRS